MCKEYYAGINTTAKLRAEGITWRQQEHQIKTGKLAQIRRGWYADKLADRNAISAIKYGGQIGCISGCEIHGLWIPPQYQHQLHICQGNRNTAQPELAKLGIITHRGGDPELNSIRSVQDCLLDVMRHHDPETALVVLESAANHNAITFNEGKALIASLSESKQRELRHFTSGAESGSETRVRLFFNRRGVPVRTQERLPRVGRVDLLVGKSMIVECDSRAHHTSEEDSTRDWYRDKEARTQGYQITRLIYSQIWNHWEDTQAFLDMILKKRKHSRPPRFRG